MGYPAIHGLSYTYTNNVQYENIWGTLPKYTKIREFETIPIFTYVDVGVSENSVPHFTQWFCWSLSLLNGYFIGNIPYIFRQTHV